MTVKSLNSLTPPLAGVNIYKQKHQHAMRKNNLKFIPEDQSREDGGENDSDAHSESPQTNKEPSQVIEELASIESSQQVEVEGSMTPSNFNKYNLASLSSSQISIPSRLPYQ